MSESLAAAFRVMMTGTNRCTLFSNNGPDSDMPSATRDVFGYSSSTTYDYRFGMPFTTTDLNGNTMKYHYDEWGRLDTLVGPNELAANKPYTIAMQYHPYLSSGDAHTTDPASYAVTSHYDCQHPTDPIKTILFCDGLGRLIQTKKDAEVDGTPKLLNSGRVEYDCFGRTIGQYHPFSSSLSDTVYNGYFDPATLTSSTYDILDRPLKVKLPTHDSTCTAYGFDSHNGKTYFRTTTTDANGIPVSVLTGTRKQQVKTIAPLGATTTFTYDALGQLRQSKDPCHHSTTYTYDMLGRLVSRTHPDAGTDTYIYDGAGNMTQHATQILSNENKSINYFYTYNRLDSIIYPNNPQNNVRYTYGDSTAGNNQRGRIALLEDASGFQTFKYGRMGEVIENNRTFVLPNERYPYSFKMQYTYDSWNRVQDITYPDGEVVRYEYNTGGMLNKVYGKVVVSNFVVIKGATPGIKDPIKPPLPSTTYTYNYIDSIRYNEFELKSDQWYGNGTKSQYTYDILQRLHTLQLRNASNVLLQNITYTYDRVGNITHIQNTAGTVSGLGGIYNYAYTYDSLYRLTYAAGTATGASYTQSTGFQADGRITLRTNTTQIGTGVPGLFQTIYTYNSDHQPHTILSAGRLKNPTTYLWDANGNMIKQGSNTTLQWDEENRLMTYSKIGLGACYFYDANGERFYKNVGNKDDLLINGSYLMGTPYYDSPVLYATPYVVATKDGYTKHYFVESERFASRIGDGKITNISSHATTSAVLASKQATVNNAAPDSIVPNKFTFLRSLPAHWSTHHTTFWQHSDHLGSASWVTDTAGHGYEHFQYNAWGGPFITQRITGGDYQSRYTFSGKERDEESGFSYFGARHYNPALSLWLSVDPLSDKYPNLSPYVYCADNPMRLVDVDGREMADFFDMNGHYLGTDGIDDGKIYIVESSNWAESEKTAWVNDAGENNISSSFFYVGKEIGWFKTPSNANLNNDAVVNIIAHYNDTGLPAIQDNAAPGNMGVGYIMRTKEPTSIHINANNCSMPCIINDYFAIKSDYDHEKGHLWQYKELGKDDYFSQTRLERESFAINYQKGLSNYDRASSDYRKTIDSYYNSLRNGK